MIDPSGQAAGLPPGIDPAQLAAMLGGGGNPDAGMDMAQGAPPEMPGADPAAGMQPAGGNPFPTTDPAFMAKMLGQIVEAQQSDQQQMQAMQQDALMGNPLFQALQDGAPMGPGAGQDGAAIAMGGELPPPPGV